MTTTRNLPPTDLRRKPSVELIETARNLQRSLQDLIELARSVADDDPYVDVVDYLPSRLRKPAQRACRTAAIQARKIARRWVARRSAVDAWVEQGSAPSRGETLSDDTTVSDESIRVAIGLRRAS